MNKKKFMVLFYDSKSHIVYQCRVLAENVKECWEVVNKTIIQNDKNQTWMQWVAMMVVQPESVDSGQMPVADADAMVLTNCQLKNLTIREVQVVTEMKDGKSVALGAANLCISERTMSTHITNINEKVGGNSLKESIAILQKKIEIK